MTTVQGKQGIWFLLFPDRENTGNFAVTQGKIWKHRENNLTMIINVKSKFIFLKLKFFYLILLCIIFTFVHVFPHAICSNFTCIFTLCVSIFIHNIYFRYETS